jgi:hypothetical protein
MTILDFITIRDPELGKFLSSDNPDLSDPQCQADLWFLARHRWPWVVLFVLTLTERRLPCPT